jgi:hypothetical protein
LFATGDASTGGGLASTCCGILASGIDSISALKKSADRFIVT